MKSVSTKSGSKPSVLGTQPRPGESQARLSSVRGAAPGSRRDTDLARRPSDVARPASERRPIRSSEEPRTGVVRRVETRGWSCLEWKAPGKPPRRPRADAPAAKVTIVQLSGEGELLRQNGPDGWLPEAGQFMHRMSTLLARSLGFEECRSLCLRNETAVLAVSSAGSSKVVAVSGPARSMANVLRRAGMS
jgi:hypothetical protein